jgi:hypothetical protein
MFSIPIHRLNPIPIFKKDTKSASESPMQITKKKGFGIKRATVYKFYWVLIALVAPEFVLFAAVNQWNEAKALLEELKKLDVPEGSAPPDNAISTSESAERHLSTAEAPPKHPLDILRPTIPVSAKHKKWADMTMTSTFFVMM